MEKTFSSNDRKGGDKSRSGSKEKKKQPEKPTFLPHQLDKNKAISETEMTLQKLRRALEQQQRHEQKCRYQRDQHPGDNTKETEYEKAILEVQNSNRQILLEQERLQNIQQSDRRLPNVGIQAVQEEQISSFDPDARRSQVQSVANSGGSFRIRPSKPKKSPPKNSKSRKYINLGNQKKDLLKNIKKQGYIQESIKMKKEEKPKSEEVEKQQINQEINQEVD